MGSTHRSSHPALQTEPRSAWIVPHPQSSLSQSAAWYHLNCTCLSMTWNPLKNHIFQFVFIPFHELPSSNCQTQPTVVQGASEQVHILCYDFNCNTREYKERQQDKGCRREKGVPRCQKSVDQAPNDLEMINHAQHSHEAQQTQTPHYQKFFKAFHIFCVACEQRHDNQSQCTNENQG